MTDVYFTVNENSVLYRDYFESVEDEKKVLDAFHTVKEKYGIEANAFYPAKGKFHIIPKGDDEKKFESMLKKSNYGQFKKNSPVAKEWCELVKDIKHMNKPRLFCYFNLIGHRWREQLFHIGTILYGHIESDGNVEFTDYVTEIKASEFYKAIEEEDEARVEIKHGA